MQVFDALMVEGSFSWGQAVPAGMFGTNFINLKRWGNAPNFGFRRYNGNPTSPTAAQLGDTVGFWGAGGFGGSGDPIDFPLENGLFCVATENHTPTAKGTLSALAGTLNGAVVGRQSIVARPSAVANDTDAQIFDVTAGILQRVTIGAANSGGAGFRLLRIPN